MLGNSIDHEKMALLISTNNHWPQNHHHIDEQKAFMDSTSGIRTIEKPNPDIVQQQQQLKCPRCDSSNTKFCYYNNYSLSQPRHFCKACKRYWTKGGTLRNVPVGGGCRKNKRVKRPVSAIDGVSSNNNNNNITTTTTTTSTSSAPPSNSNPPSQVSPLFYGFHTNPSDLNIPFSRFSASGVSNNVENISGFDHLQPQLNSLGLGFSFGDYRNGFDNPNKQIQDIVGSNSLFSSYNSIFTSPSSNTTSATMASVLASKFSSGSGLKDGREPNSNFQTLTSFDGLQIGNTGGHDEVNMRMKYVKSEDALNRLEWNSSAHHHQTEQQINGLSDPSAIYWNGTSVSSNWHDPSNNNIGSSVPSLI